MKQIFWNVDTQEDFMSEPGALYVPGAESIKPALGRLTRYARAEGIQVVNTADMHYDDAAEISDTPDFVNTFPAHCLRGTPGADFIRETRPGPSLSTYVVDWEDARVDHARVRTASDVVIYKDAFDVFAGNAHTDSVLTTINPDEAVVYGVAGNVCVDYAVMGLLERDVRVTVVTDATKAIPAEAMKETLRKWKLAGASLTTLEQVLWGER
jgi:nicotinamidase/pyrazinamidase